MFDRSTLLHLLWDFPVFGNAGSGTVKIVAGYYQLDAAQQALAAMLPALLYAACGEAAPPREPPVNTGCRAPKTIHRAERIGAIRCTQGSGKSLLRTLYAEPLVREPAVANSTLVVIADCDGLDDQLFGTSAMCSDLIPKTPVQVESRDDLRGKLDGQRDLTTIQKLVPADDENCPKSSLATHQRD